MFFYEFLVNLKKKIMGISNSSLVVQVFTRPRPTLLVVWPLKNIIFRLNYVDENLL